MRASSSAMPLMTAPCAVEVNEIPIRWPQSRERHSGFSAASMVIDTWRRSCAILRQAVNSQSRSGRTPRSPWAVTLIVTVPWKSSAPSPSITPRRPARVRITEAITALNPDMTDAAEALCKL